MRFREEIQKVLRFCHATVPEDEHAQDMEYASVTDLTRFHLEYRGGFFHRQNFIMRDSVHCSLTSLWNFSTESSTTADKELFDDRLWNPQSMVDYVVRPEPCKVTLWTTSW